MTQTLMQAHRARQAERRKELVKPRVAVVVELLDLEVQGYVNSPLVRAIGRVSGGARWWGPNMPTPLLAIAGLIRRIAVGGARFHPDDPDHPDRFADRLAAEAAQVDAGLVAAGWVQDEHGEWSHPEVPRG